MLSFTRQAVEPRLARLVVRTLHRSSSQAKQGAVSENRAALPTSSPTKTHDLGLEQRRTARLAREALRAKQANAAAKGIAKKKSNNVDPMMSSTAAVLSGPPGQNGQNQSQQRKRSKRDQVQSSARTRGGTERSRVAASEPGPAETIMAFAQRGAANRRAARAEGARSLGEEVGALTNELVVDLPQFTGPESISSDLATTLNTVPNLTSSLPPLPAARKLQKAPDNWVKGVYGGDYSQYQLETPHYLKGARGLRSTYAKIIIGRNPTIPFGAQQQLIATVRKMAQEDGP